MIITAEQARLQSLRIDNSNMTNNNKVLLTRINDVSMKGQYFIHLYQELSYDEVRYFETLGYRVENYEYTLNGPQRGKIMW